MQGHGGNYSWTAGWKVSEWCESLLHYFGDICITTIFLLLLESLLTIWLLHLDSVLEVDPVDSLSTWRFLKIPSLPTSRPCRSYCPPVTSSICLKGPPRTLSNAVCHRRRLPSQPRQLSCWSSQNSSSAGSVRAGSELTAKKGSLFPVLWMSK